MYDIYCSKIAFCPLVAVVPRDPLPGDPLMAFRPQGGTTQGTRGTTQGTRGNTQRTRGTS